ncbi:MAG: hypothetical protein Q6361_03900 [Candidatus Hermodarchaeota archaeon]|nr:hypothetical protein [Candidatus Hermodarchaeota archaeon]
MSKAYSIEEIQEALALREYIESLFSGKPDLPEVDMDKVHESPKIRRRFTMTDAFIEGLPDSPSKEFLGKYRKKYMALEVAEFEQKIIDNQNAMERLQELVKKGWRINFFLYTGDGTFAVDMMDEDENNVAAEGVTLPEAILNIKIDEGENAE